VWGGVRGRGREREGERGREGYFFTKSWPQYHEFFGTTDMKKLRSFLIQNLAFYEHLNFLILVLNKLELILNLLEIQKKKLENFLWSHKAKGNRSRTILFWKFTNW
jgi:hypothetical protein